jgi:hypothetical protein
VWITVKKPEGMVFAADPDSASVKNPKDNFGSILGDFFRRPAANRIDDAGRQRAGMILKSQIAPVCRKQAESF